jgi:hypothetical protein
MLTQPAPIIEHFMRRGQVFLLRPYFPSTASYNVAMLSAYTDQTLQLIRDQQVERKLKRDVERLQQLNPEAY